MTGVGLRILAWWRKPELRTAATLGLLAAIERVVLYRVYAPIEFSDTLAYFRLAGALATSGLSAYDGTRVPGYPAWVAILGMDPARVWVAQLVVGWGMTMLLFLLTWQTTRRAGLALLVGGLYSAIPGQFLFESNLLTESLTGFLGLAATVLVLSLDRIRSPGARAVVALGAGIAASWAGLVRALFFILPAWLFPFVLTSAGGARRQKTAEAVLFLAPAVLFLGGWLGFIQRSYGMLAPDTMGGFHLIQHTGAFFELLPDEQALLRDTYVRYRDERIAERGDQTNTIWDAIPEMSEVSGLGFYDLSRELQRVSVQLILAHPDKYLASVVDGWISFWKAPVYWDAAQLKGEPLRTAMGLLAAAGRGVSWIANGLFLAFVGLAAVSPRIRRFLHVDRVALVIGGWVGLASLLQSLPDHGDNPRFLVPLQMLVIFVVARALSFGLRRPTPPVA
ncbi:MAG: hypothetical protein WD906_07970 [Anaerolineales bacterium]